MFWRLEHLFTAWKQAWFDRMAVLVASPLRCSENNNAYQSRPFVYKQNVLYLGLLTDTVIFLQKGP